MIDLETMGTGPQAAICAIAAVPFCLETGNTGDPFCTNVDLATSMEQGMEVNASTIYWWLNKDLAVREALGKDARPLRTVLQQLQAWKMMNCDFGVKVWAKGPSFDLVILDEAYRLCGYQEPFWHYAHERCVRTYLDGMEDEVKEDVPFEGDPHNPLHDALHQVRQLRYVYLWKVGSVFPGEGGEQ